MMKAPQDWWSRPRLSRLASVLYPQHADEATRREMSEIARGEGKRPPASQPLLADAQRGCQSPLGGKAK
jgi:hypothetical protein